MRSRERQHRRNRRTHRDPWVQLVLIDVPRIMVPRRTPRQRAQAQADALEAVQLVLDFERPGLPDGLTDEDIGREAYHLALRLMRRFGVAVTQPRAVEALARRAERRGPWGSAAASWMRLMAAQSYRPTKAPAPFRRPGPHFEGAGWSGEHGVDWLAEGKAAAAEMYTDVPDDTWVSIEAARELGPDLEHVRGGPREKRKPQRLQGAQPTA